MWQLMPKKEKKKKKETHLGCRGHLIARCVPATDTWPWIASDRASSVAARAVTASRRPRHRP